MMTNGLALQQLTMALFLAIMLLMARPLNAFSTAAKPRRTSFTQLFYSNEMDMPQQPRVSQPSSVVTTRSNIGSPTPTLSPPKVTHIATPEEWQHAVVPRTNAWVVVRFHSETCRACKAAKPAFYRLASQAWWPEGVQFVEVPSTAKAVFQQCRVTRMPWGQVYHQGALVHQGSLTKSKLRYFQNELQRQVAAAAASAGETADTTAVTSRSQQHQPQPVDYNTWSNPSWRAATA